jgi:thiamine-monophosphate kinase
MKLRDLGEFPFLRRLRSWLPADPHVLLGLGDDCAALALSGTTLLTTDAMIENVHFRREWTSFSTLGEKAFTVNASDIAAMGGEPAFALLSLAVPQECAVEDLDAFFAGFVQAAGECGAALIGGNMSAAPCLMFSVTLLGRAPHKLLTRAGAQVGDDLYVTGTLGDAALGLRMLQEGRDSAEAQVVKDRFLRPMARLAVGSEAAAHGLATAMVDVSDGLLQDLSHLCEESRVGAVVEAPALPLSRAYRVLLGDGDWNVALTGGEDYELLFSATAELRSAIEALARRSNCPITRIGRVVPQAEGLSVRGPDGALYTSVHAGYDHFRLS